MKTSTTRFALLLAAAAIFGMAAVKHTLSAQESLTIALPGSIPRIDHSFKRQPLVFEPNLGQTDAEVEFVTRGPGYQLFLTATEAVMVLRMRLVGANDSPPIHEDVELPGKVNYFIGNDPSRWRTNISTFAKVQDRDVNPGTDLVYYANQEGRLKYDFVLAPGADPDLIALEFDGADRTELDASGDLVAWVGGRPVRWQKPVVYQEFNGRRTEIAGAYRLDDGALAFEADTSHRIGFEWAAYDRSRTLVIDPVLVYSTYRGGSQYERPGSVTTDIHGNAYVVGYTGSVDFPTKDPFQAGLLGAGDFFVTKLSPSGEWVYSSDLGGSGWDSGEDVAVDFQGNVHVAGSVASKNFPEVYPTRLRIFLVTWDHPRPDQEFVSFQFVSKRTPAAPFLLAVTAE